MVCSRVRNISLLQYFLWAWKGTWKKDLLFYLVWWWAAHQRSPIRCALKWLNLCQYLNRWCYWDNARKIGSWYRQTYGGVLQKFLGCFFHMIASKSLIGASHMEYCHCPIAGQLSPFCQRRGMHKILITVTLFPSYAQTRRHKVKSFLSKALALRLQEAIKKVIQRDQTRKVYGG